MWILTSRDKESQKRINGDKTSKNLSQTPKSTKRREHPHTMPSKEFTKGTPGADVSSGWQYNKLFSITMYQQMLIVST